MPRSPVQQVALALGPKFSAFLSILGSSWIILEVTRDKKKQAMVYHRLLLGLSCLDVLISSAWFLSTWPVPEEVEGLHGNVGNEYTCIIQGFMIQLKAGNPFYNSWLALYFVAVVRLGWSETQLRKVEPFLHLSSFAMAVGTSTSSLLLGLYGNANLWCWIEGKYPLYRMFFFYVWYWASLVIVTISMITVVFTVKRQETSSLRYSANSYNLRPQKKRASTGKNTKKVATQAVLYIGAYCLTALFSTTVRVMQAFTTNIPFWAILGMTLFYPAQGFFNFLIYVRPRYLRYRQKHPEWTLTMLVRETLARAIRGGSTGVRSSTTTATLHGSASLRSTGHTLVADVVSATFEEEDEDHKLGTALEENEEEKEHQDSSDLECGGAAPADRKSVV